MANEATSSASHVVISPSLLAGLDIEKPVPPQFYIGWKELFGLTYSEPSAPQFTQGTFGELEVIDDDAFPDIDSFLLEASRILEEKEVEELFIQASQTIPDSPCVFESVNLPCPPIPTVSASGSRFGSPKNAKRVAQVRKEAVPAKTRANTSWAENTWREWAAHRSSKVSEEKKSGHELRSEFSSMSVPAMNYWLERFVLEVRAKSGKSYKKS